MIRRLFAGLVLAGLFALGCGREPAAPPRAVLPPVSDRLPPPKKERTIADSGKEEKKEAPEPLDENKDKDKDSPAKIASEPQPPGPAPAAVEVKAPERPQPVGPMPPFERRLPATTCGFVSVPTMPEASRAWEQTSLAALWNDPAMKPFRAAANARVNRGTAYARWTLGLTLEELSATVSGELAVAVLRGTEKEGPGLVLLADVGGATEKADSLIQTAAARLVRGGAKRSEHKARGAAAIVLDLPPALQQGQLLQAVYLRQGDLLVAASNLVTATAVLDRAQDGPGGLGQREPFRTSVALAENDLGNAHLRWFIEPLAFWLTMRDLEGTGPGELDVLRALGHEGFEALQGIGGAAVLATATHEVTARAYVFAPPPYQKAMRMLVFPDVEASPPPAFVPAGVASCLALSTDWAKSFDASSTLFDELFGGGEKNVFEDILRGIREEPVGPRVDVRRELIHRLGQPLWLLSLRPGKDEPRSLLWAVPATAEKDLAGAIRKLNESQEVERSLPFGEYGIFQVLPEKKEGEKEGVSAFAGAVYQRHLLLAARPNVIRAVAAKPEATLADSAALKDTWRQVEEQVGKKAFLRGMVRHEEMIRDSLQRLRTNTNEGDGVPERLLRRLLPSGPGDDALAGMKLLPEMSKLKQQPEGTWLVAGVNREKGWLVLVQLPRSAP
jgi:hypothetical protein